MTTNWLRRAFGSANHRMRRLQRLADTLPRLFAAITIVPVFAAFVVVAVTTIPLPDLVAARLAMQPRPGQGTDGVVLTLAIQNRGGSSVSRSVARYYLVPYSSDGGTDQFLGQQHLGILSPGDVATVSKTIALPDSVAPGTYIVRACVAPMVPTTEQSLRNNCQQSAPFQIRPNRVH